MSESYAEQAAPILIDNLRAAETGQPMRNRVR
jgi:hypothetical protein